MSEQHTAENDAPSGEHFPTTPVQCACGWRETDPDSGTWIEHMTSAPEVIAAGWLDAAGIVETYETAQEAAAGLRVMASLLTRPIPPAEPR